MRLHCHHSNTNKKKKKTTASWEDCWQHTQLSLTRPEMESGEHNSKAEKQQEEEDNKDLYALLNCTKEASVCRCVRACVRVCMCVRACVCMWRGGGLTLLSTDSFLVSFACFSKGRRSKSKQSFCCWQENTTPTNKTGRVKLLPRSGARQKRRKLHKSIPMRELVLQSMLHRCPHSPPQRRGILRSQDCPVHIASCQIRH